MQIRQLPANAAWLDLMEIWLRGRQGNLLTPYCVVGAAAPERAIATSIAAHNAQARFITWTYTSNTLEKKLRSHL
ncbi:MAG: hypothetical protein J7454_14910 [Roseiflexus sp.]|nr:hypothetical protein [Roseiflexus sp.]